MNYYLKSGKSFWTRFPFRIYIDLIPSSILFYNKIQKINLSVSQKQSEIEIQIEKKNLRKHSKYHKRKYIKGKFFKHIVAIIRIFMCKRNCK